MVAGSDVARHINPSIFNLPPTQLLRWCHVHHPSSCLRQSSSQTGKSYPDLLPRQQAARSRHVSRADLPPSVLWRNRQTKTPLVLRPKLRNRRGDFEAQITKPVAAGFEAQTGKSSTTLVLRLNQETDHQF
jgi:hypothetical protein